MTSVYARIVPLLLTLAACAAPSPPVANNAPPPEHVRPDLAPKWTDARGQIVWPPAEGFAGAPVFAVLPPGTVLDRFGSEAGRFFSPKGAAFDARALPYVCEQLDYRTYRVMRPLPVWAGRAAPWFDQPGGATQVRTDATAARLKDDHIVEPVPAAGKPCQ